MTATPTPTPPPLTAAREPRFLPVEGAFNTRDVGGLPTEDGGWLREGVLLRSDTPQLMTPADVDLLVSTYAVRTVLDLRFAAESDREGIGRLAAADVRHVNVPIRTADRGVLPQMPGPERPAVEEPWMTSLRHYLGYFTAGPEQIVAAVRTLAGSAALPALVHCAAGKDRTGVVVGLTLSAVGVADADVAADFAASTRRLREVLDRLRGLPSYGERIDLVPYEVHQSNPETMLELLGWLRREHGGAAAWLTANGVTKSELEALREGLVQRT